MSATIPREFDAPLTACPLCASTQLQPHDRDYQGITIDGCRECRLLFMNPQYSDRYLANYYGQYIDGDVIENSPYTRRRIDAKTEAFTLIQRFAEPGRFLAVGCGDGLEIELARRHGWEAEGFDVDPQATQRVSRRLGVRVHTGNFCDLPWPADHYDCVFMDQVLEHPKNPQDYLREVHRILRPGGVLFIGCPNIRSISSSVKTLLGKLGVKKHRGKHYDTWHHLFYYSPGVLSNIVQRHYGFQSLVVEGDPFTGHTELEARQQSWRKAITWLQRKTPMLESTFRLLCRKSPSAANPRARTAA